MWSGLFIFCSARRHVQSERMSPPATPSSPSAPDGSSSVLSLRGVGPGIAEKLGRMGITTLQDLLFHLPLRYQDRTRIAAIGSLRPGDEISVRGEVQLTEIKHGRRRMLLSRISDGTGFLTLRFFHFSARQQASLARGARIHCFGEVRAGSGGLEMVHPEYRNIGDDDDSAEEKHLTPVYPVTEGLRQLKLRSLMDAVLADPALLEAQLVDWLPARCLPSGEFPGLVDAVRYVHHPPPDAPVQALQEGVHPSQQRLAFEELLAQQLSLRQLRAKHQRHVAPRLGGLRTLSQRLLSGLPFELTGAQQKVTEAIFADLDQAIPMQRLVQGDVGCGKTIVAALAACHAVEAGHQVAVMAPTELRAEQHRPNFPQ